MKRYLKIIPLLLLATMFTATAVRPVEAAHHHKKASAHARAKKARRKARRAAAKLKHQTKKATSH
jgi:hypothetical protein